MSPTSLSFVIPMYNERETIRDTVKKLTSMARELSGDYEIVIVDDGSTDESSLIADKMAETDPKVRAVHLKKNTKFGGAFRKGLKAARKEVIIYTDSDLPVELSDIKKALLLMDRCDIVTAYSKVKKGENLRRKVMSRVYNFLIELFFRTGIRDINSGFKIYRRKIFDSLELTSDSPFIDVEIFIKSAKKGFTVEQYPIIFKHREKGKSYISRPSVVLKTVADMLKFRLGL